MREDIRWADFENNLITLLQTVSIHANCNAMAERIKHKTQTGVFVLRRTEK
jgi:hypothetical protein